MRYSLFGYPEDVAFELTSAGTALLRPDLVYSEGHIRRRLTDLPIPSVYGTEFFELSQIAGAGCSGSPVFARAPGRNWQVVGVYVGERVNDRATSVGYAARMEPLLDWIPEILGHSLVTEANQQMPPPLSG